MRFWTVEEAEAELPRVRELVELVQRYVAPAAPPTDDAPAPHPERVEAVVAELEDKGIVFRDPAAGLVDFPSLSDDGDIRFLCWRIADGDTLAWWHHPDEGFAGRKPL